MKKILISLLSLTLLLSLAGCELKSDTPKYIQDGLETSEELPVNDTETEEEDSEEPEPELESDANDDVDTEPEELPENEESEETDLTLELKSETNVESE